MAEGSAYYVSIMPTFTGFAKRMTSGVTKASKEAGVEASKEFNKSFKTKPVEVTTKFNQAEMRRMERQLRDLGKTKSAVIQVNATANTKQIDGQMAKIREDIARKRGASVGINIDEKSKGSFVSAATTTGKRAGGAMGKAMKGALSFAGIGAALYGGEVLKQAGDFQQAMILLNTAGGEAKKNLPAISKGVANIAKSTGTSLDQVSEGMYTVEKAGIRGSKGLDVLKAAAQGARGEGANLSTMTTALTSIMASYGKRMKDPVKATNELVAAAGASKTNMQEFADALSTAQPIAAAAHISFAELGGAIGTLTSHGTSAREATHELSNTIRNLQAPNNVASKEMAQFGLNSNDVSTKLGKRGLQGTIELLSSTILHKMGPSGKILLGAFNQSKIAAQDAGIEYNKLPLAGKRLADQYKKGSISQKDFTKGMRELTPAAASLTGQWATAEKKANGFNDQLKSGTPQAKTYISSLKKMTGGATGLNTVLQLTGESSGKFTASTAAINKAGKEGGKTVTAWKEDQTSFNVQMSVFSQTIKVTAVEIATKLLPPLITAVKWIGQNKKTVLEIVGAYIAFNLAIKISSAAIKAYRIQQEIAAGTAKAMTVTQWALNLAMENFPLVAIITGLIALGVALVIAYKKSATFRAIVQTALRGVVTAFHAVVDAGKVAVNGVVTAFHTVTNVFTKTIPNAVMTALSFLKTHWKAIVEIILLPLFPLGALVLKYWGPIKGAFVSAFNAIASVAKSVWAVVTRVTSVALTVLKYAGMVIYAIIALPIVLAFKAIRKIVTTVWGWIGPYVMAGLSFLKRVIQRDINAVKAVWSAVWGAIKRVAISVWNGISSFFTAAWNRFKKGAQRDWNAIKNVILAIWHTIDGPLKAVWNALSAFFSAAWKRFKTGAQRDWHAIVSVVTAVWHGIEGPLKATWNGIKSFFEGAFNGFKKTTKTIWGEIAGAIPAAIRGIGKGLSSAMSAVKNTFEAPFKWIVNNVINKFIGLLNSVPGVKLPTISWGNDKGGSGPVSSPNGKNSGIAQGGPVHAANGTVIPGYAPGKDRVHALLSPGEGVLVPEAVRGLGGANAVHAINNRFNKRNGKSGRNPAGQFLFGGIIGKAWNGIKAGAGAAKNFGQTALNKGADWAVDGAAKIANAVVGHVPGPGLMKSIGHGAVNTVAKAVKDKIAGVIGKSGGGKKGDMSAHSASASSAQNYARSILGQFGWGDGQMSSLLSLWNGESGWNNQAANPTSSAFGIAQFLDSTWSGKKYPKTTNFKQQVYDGLQYIQGSYGSPSAALTAWLGRSPHWYAKGTKGAKRGPAIVGEQGPELMMMQGGEQILNAKQTKMMGYAKGTVDLRGLAKYLVSAFRSLTGNSNSGRIGEVAGNTTKRIQDQLSGIVGASNDTINKSRSSLASLRKSTAKELDKMAKDRQKASDKIAKAQATLNDKKATQTQRRNARTAITQANKDIKRSLDDRKKLLDQTSKQAQQLTEAITGAKSTKSLAESSGNALVKAAQIVNNKLKALAAQRDKISQQLADARSFSAGISSAATDSALAGSASQTGAGIQSNLSAKVNAVKKFTSLLRTLSHKGFNKAILSQVVAMGVTDGTNLAAVLVKDSKSQVKSLNGTQNSLNYNAGVLGRVGTSASLGEGASTNYLGQLIGQKAATSRQIAATERGAVNLFQGATIVVRDNAQLDALVKKAAFAVSR